MFYLRDQQAVQEIESAFAIPSNWEIFLQSLIIILEGFEAILIIGALVAYMLKK